AGHRHRTGDGAGASARDLLERRCLRRIDGAARRAPAAVPGEVNVVEERNLEYRRLGSTGVRVSPLCLGTMMFGKWGNTDEVECIRVIHQALDAGINFV